MLKNVLKMSKWFLLFIIANLIAISTCHLSLFIFGNDTLNQDFPVFSPIEAIIGTHLTLRCVIVGSKTSYPNAELLWSKKSKHIRFKNESDLVRLAQKGYPYLYDLYNDNLPYNKSKAFLEFSPVKYEDQGTYFCMYLRHMMFRVLQVKVNERKTIVHPSLSCKKDKFRCVESGHCINLHYKCDGREDCIDGSDEHPGVCNGDPCRGKIQCPDRRCIPTMWCCDISTDDNCTVTVRPSCCPILPDPYDPTNWYNNQTHMKEMNKGNGSRYLFISICVISAILSFVLFLFIISKICGFDKGPNRSRNLGGDSIRNPSTSFSEFNRCEHSECAIRREFNPNIACVYRNNLNSTSSSNELVDPLIEIIRASSPMELSDQPPSYEEVVSLSTNIDKGSISDLINAPPPPYCSTKFLPETENGNGNNLNASNNSISNNNCNNQSINCDIEMSSNIRNNIA